MARLEFGDYPFFNNVVKFAKHHEFRGFSFGALKSASMIGPGRGGTSYLTDFDETWPV